MMSLWPFMKWRINIVGPLSMAPAQQCFLLVLTDYYSKWITTKAYCYIRFSVDSVAGELDCGTPIICTICGIDNEMFDIVG